MIVVADASPLNYLIQIESANVLHALFGRVLVPVAVMEELRHARAPSEVKSWLLQIPSWIEVRTIEGPQDEALQFLDPGEREAIMLATETHADLLLMDERQGRLEAKRRRITTTGTLGVLLAAGEQGLLNAEAVFQRLVSQTSFRATVPVQETFLAQCRKLREKKS
jgi:predicted nucleic acid-binding protein